MANTADSDDNPAVAVAGIKPTSYLTNIWQSAFIAFPVCNTDRSNFLMHAGLWLLLVTKKSQMMTP